MVNECSPHGESKLFPSTSSISVVEQDYPNGLMLNACVLLQLGILDPIFVLYTQETNKS